VPLILLKSSTQILPLKKQNKQNPNQISSKGPQNSNQNQNFQTPKIKSQLQMKMNMNNERD
jgi:hypothetical protein